LNFFHYLPLYSLFKTFLGGRVPLCGIGVTSLTSLIIKPDVSICLRAVDLPGPIPFT
jgi:hypothetical protein